MIARRPKKEYTLEEVVEALRIIAGSGEGGEDKDKQTPKIAVEELLTALEQNGKTAGDDLSRNESKVLIKDCNLENDNNEIVIEDFAKYLLSR